MKVQTFKQKLYNARIIIITYRETREQAFGAFRANTEIICHLPC